MCLSDNKAQSDELMQDSSIAGYQQRKVVIDVHSYSVTELSNTKKLIPFFLLVIYAEYKTLGVSDKCDRGDPTLNLFKYDKNKPQRLSFLHINSSTGRTEGWGVPKFYASNIQVMSECDWMVTLSS